jgi:hypothetical protein
MRFVHPTKPIASDNKKLGSLSVDPTSIEVPEAESLPDAVTFLGGEEKALEFINSQIATEAKNAGRQILRTGDFEEGETKETAISRLVGEVIEAVKGWTFGGTRKGTGVTQKKAKEAVDSVLADNTKTSWTREELLALLAK